MALAAPDDDQRHHDPGRARRAPGGRQGRRAHGRRGGEGRAARPARRRGDDRRRAEARRAGTVARGGAAGDGRRRARPAARRPVPTTARTHPAPRRPSRTPRTRRPTARRRPRSRAAAAATTSRPRPRASSRPSRAPPHRRPPAVLRDAGGCCVYSPTMSVRPIVLLGDPRLRLKGETVDSFGKPLHELLDDLTDSMRHAPGVGLAAPQLGEPLRACVIEVENHLYELDQPRDRPVHRRRPRPRGLPVDPGLRRLRHAQGEGLGRRPEPHRQEDQGRGLGAPGPGAPARARPPRRQAVHRLPRLDGRAHLGEPARRRGRGDAGVAADARLIRWP